MKKALSFLLWVMASGPSIADGSPWFVRGEHNECMPIEKASTIPPMVPIGIGEAGIKNPESLAAALQAKGVPSAISPVRPGNGRIIEIKAPGGTFWLVLAPKADCAAFVDSFN